MAELNKEAYEPLTFDAIRIGLASPDKIRRMSEQLIKENPKALILRGKINRAFYEECCGTKKAQ